MTTRDLSVNQRIKIIIDEYSLLTQRGFADRIGVSQSAVSSLFSRRENRPGLDMLQKIAIAFPEISLDWLLVGRGPMLRQEGRILAPAESAHSNQAQIIAPEHAQQLLDIIRQEVAEQMAAVQPNVDVYKKLNEEMVIQRNKHALAWQDEAETVRAKLAAFGDAQIPEAFELADRLESIERAISVLKNTKPAPNGLLPDVAYRIGVKPDYNRPFDGLLSRRLNISEDEALKLVESDETGYTLMDGYGYEVSELLVRHYLRRMQRRQQSENIRPTPAPSV